MVFTLRINRFVLLEAEILRSNLCPFGIPSLFFPSAEQPVVAHSDGGHFPLGLRRKYMTVTDKAS